MNKLLDKNLELTAVFVISDIMAIGASKAILKRGYGIPDDISIIGFDGIEIASYFHPSLTTIKQPQKEMGKKSIEVLFKMMENSSNDHIILDTELLVKESCKKINGR